MSKAADFPSFKKRGGLVIAIIQDADTKAVLMHGFMDSLALAKTLESGEVYLWSTSRNKFWHKGEESGNVMRWESLAADCDGDAVLIQVRVIGNGYACHLERKSCFVPIDTATISF